MLSIFPQEITEYLISELPPFTGILLIKTDAEGIVDDYYGPYKEYLGKEPKKGKPIHDYVPALFSMIPPMVSPMVLNKITFRTSVIADIHMLMVDENEYWVLFVDQSSETKCIKDLMQKINESKLKSDNKSNNQLATFLKPLEVFGYLCLSVESNEIAVVDGGRPEWFNALKPELINTDKIEYVEVFPYLEVFLFEAEEFWSQNKDGKLSSGIWTETLGNDEELVLTAFAVFSNNKRYIIIQALDEGFDKEQYALQMAREQKLAYEKLEKAESKLKVLLDYKDKFVSIVSHDLRSPVAAVLGIAEMLVNDKEELSKLDVFYQEMILSIKEEMLRLLDYNDKLYHWSNLELGNFKLLKSKTSLDKIIQTAYRTAHKKLKAKNIAFSTNLKNDIEVDVDLTLFLQLINNLISNAIKFTPENGKISIDIKKLKPLQIVVVDNGVGMPKEVSDNIFDGFARNSTIGTDGEKGTGLGLGIVEKIISAHGFSIYVESEVGKGSEFIITF